jgi:3-deoxy-7-phosphoheptulonate synthase
VKIIKLQNADDIKRIKGELQKLGLWTSVYENAAEAFLLSSDDSTAVQDQNILAIDGIESVSVSKSPHPMMDRQPPEVRFGGISIGGERPVLMAGPCSVESEEQIHQAAAMVANAGATVLRGGCFKPRTNPYSFQGVGPEGLGWMREAANAHDLLVVTEAMSPTQVDIVGKHADIFQIGARNMQNFDLLHAVGRANMPVLLKRGLSSTLSEWLQAAEHILYSGASHVILCERGVRGFDGSTRFLFDLGAVSIIRHIHNLPIIADPSHATGRKDLIPHMGAAALAAGADGLIIEAHPRPEDACSDGPQQLSPEALEAAARRWGFIS